MLAPALQLQIVRFQKQTRISRGPWQLLPRRGDALLLPRDDAQLLRRGVALQSPHAGELLPLRGGEHALPPGDELSLPRGDAQLRRPGSALPVQLSDALVHAPAPARL